MKIQTLIDPSQVHLNLDAATLEEALNIVSEFTAPAVHLSSEAVAEGLLEREKLGSTAIGGGFAIPHCKLRGVKDLVIILARFRKSVPFGTPHGEDVRFLFVVLSPPDHPAVHLQALSQIARTLKSEEIRRRLMEVQEPAEIVEIVKGAADGEHL
jgi:mannitol/fructose-specific phosphotransferase system IIA component (Ntr-type)